MTSTPEMGALHHDQSTRPICVTETAGSREFGHTNPESGDTDVMGYNPYRKFTAKPSDYVLVAVAVLVAIALVVWAFFG
jgi:hypothetical protein